jgi:ATP-dependent Zn protease
MSSEASGKAFRRAPLLFMLLVAVALWAGRDLVGPPGSARVPYSEVVAAIEAGTVAEAEIGTVEIIATLKAEAWQRPQALVAERVPDVEDPALLEALRRQGVKTRGRPERGSWWGPLLWGVLPLLLLHGRGGPGLRGQ